MSDGGCVVTVFAPAPRRKWLGFIALAVLPCALFWAVLAAVWMRLT